ncbi:MAG: 50S ribosomal protein L21 [Acidobacteria bacterium]|nr:50S ribosomal protein L21 [Acidobacteriota bacterium]
MYAVIETGGTQFRVAPGDVIHVNKLAAEAGSAVEFDKVLAISDGNGNLAAGAAAAAARVRGSVEKQFRDDKVIVFKFKRKKQYKKTQGHRQYLTAVKIEEIVS